MDGVGPIQFIRANCSRTSRVWPPRIGEIQMRDVEARVQLESPTAFADDRVPVVLLKGHINTLDRRPRKPS